MGSGLSAVRPPTTGAPGTASQTGSGDASSPAAAASPRSPRSAPTAAAAARQPSSSSSRQNRQQLETTVSTLSDELRSAKQKLASTERELQDMVDAAENKGVPSTECLVCLNASVNAVLVPCGHLCLCVACANLLQSNTKTAFSCPLCRMQVANIHRVYLPMDPKEPRPKRIVTTPRTTTSSEAPKVAGAEIAVQTSPTLQRVHAAESTSVGASPVSVASDAVADAAGSPQPVQLRPTRALPRPPRQAARADAGGTNAAALDDLDLPLASRALRMHPPTNAAATNQQPTPGSQQRSPAREQPPPGGDEPTSSPPAAGSEEEESDGVGGGGGSGSVGGGAGERPPETFDFVVPGGWEPSPLLAATWG